MKETCNECKSKYSRTKCPLCKFRNLYDLAHCSFLTIIGATIFAFIFSKILLIPIVICIGLYGQKWLKIINREREYLDLECLCHNCPDCIESVYLQKQQKLNELYKKCLPEKCTTETI